MIYLDKNKQEIKDGDGILFTHEDSSRTNRVLEIPNKCKVMFLEPKRKKIHPTFRDR